MTALDQHERTRTIVRAGGTVADVAADLNVAFEQAARAVEAAGCRPTAAGTSAEDRGIAARRAGALGPTVVPSDLLAAPLAGVLDYFAARPVVYQYGGTAPRYPAVADVRLHRALHGETRDSETGAPAEPGDIVTIDPDMPALATNQACWTGVTIASHYWPKVMTDSRWTFAGPDGMTFCIETRHPHDWTRAGGTPVPDLMTRWVMDPLFRYWDRAPDLEPVWRVRAPFAMAWWAWDQLELYGLVKGLSAVAVEFQRPHAHTATIRAADRWSGLCRLAGAGDQPVARPSPKFDPSIAR